MRMQLKYLEYLSNKMEATVAMISEVGSNKPSNPVGSANAILCCMRNKNLVAFLPDLKAWCITKQGREYLESMKL